MAPKKRKGKMANKLAAMSDEERERYLQHRAALQEEKRRRKEQLVATFIKNKLKREEVFTRINTAKINQNWRLLLRKIKSGELQQEVESMWHTFRRHVDKREANITDLLRALDLSGRQYCDMLQAHLETIERLEEVHLDHVSDLRLLINAQTCHLINKAMADIATIQLSQEKRKRAMQTVLSAMIDAIPARNYARYEKKVQAEELKQKLRAERESYASDRENKLESMWSETKDILTRHATKTAAKRKVIKKLESMDHDWMTELDHLDKRSKYLYRIHKLGEERLAALKMHTHELAAERYESLSCYKALLSSSDRDLKKDDAKFRKMTLCSEDAIKELKAMLNQGEKIIAQLNIVQRLQTKEEHDCILSLRRQPAARPSLHGQSDKFYSEESTESDSLELREMKIYAKLELFWLRYNKAHVEVSTARIKRDMILLENSQLRTQLRNYVSDISRAPSIYAQKPVGSLRSHSIYSTDGRMTATASEVSQC